MPPSKLELDNTVVAKFYSNHRCRRFLHLFLNCCITFLRTWLLTSFRRYKLFTVECTLSIPCSRSDPPLTRQGAALAHLDSLPPHDLVLWTDGSVPFPFGKGGSGVLASCCLCGTKATLTFSAGPVCSSFSAEPCAILHAF